MEDERVRGLRVLGEHCERRANVTIPGFESVVGRFSEEDEEMLRRMREEDMTEGRGIVLHEVVLISEEVFGLAFGTLVCLTSDSDSGFFNHTLLSGVVGYM